MPVLTLDRSLIAPARMGTDDGAQWMHDQYRDFRAILDRAMILEYENLADACITREYEFRTAVSIFQASRPIAGNAGEEIISKGYGAILGYLIDEKKQQEPIPKARKRSHDVLLLFNRALLVLSVTTRPQERKDDTWKAEAEKAHQFYTPQLNHRKRKKIEVIFRAILFEGGREKAEEKERLMNGMGSCVAVDDVEGHADSMRELMGKVN